jgi:hypothetical protein
MMMNSRNRWESRNKLHDCTLRDVLRRSFWAACCIAFACIPLYADSISVSGDPGSLVVNTAVAGSEPTVATDATTTYSVDTTPANRRILGRLNTPMPANTELKITLQAPTGGTSWGVVSLNASDQVLVSGIPHHTNQGGLSITYEFSATVQAGSVSSTSRTVTLTLADQF